MAGNLAKHIASFEKYREKGCKNGFNIDGLNPQEKKELIVSHSKIWIVK